MLVFVLLPHLLPLSGLQTARILRSSADTGEGGTGPAEARSCLYTFVGVESALSSLRGGLLPRACWDAERLAIPVHHLELQ